MDLAVSSISFLNHRPWFLQGSSGGGYAQPQEYGGPESRQLAFAPKDTRRCGGRRGTGTTLSHSPIPEPGRARRVRERSPDLSGRLHLTSIEPPRCKPAARGFRPLFRQRVAPPLLAGFSPLSSRLPPVTAGGGLCPWNPNGAPWKSLRAIFVNCETTGKLFSDVDPGPRRAVRIPS
jgi:hypothetical protein